VGINLIKNDFEAMSLALPLQAVGPGNRHQYGEKAAKIQLTVHLMQYFVEAP
jgi:hypothetical protein